MITEIKECRICGSKNLETVLDLGRIHPSAFLRDDQKLSEDKKQPLTLCQCGDCGLVQLKHTIDLDLMYKQYWYSSSLNKSMVSSLREIVNEIEERYNLNALDTVVDIGCNDGTMLNLYTKNIYKLGFDPSLNLKRTGEFAFINNYFSAEEYFNTFSEIKAKVVTAIAMFYDLPDPNKFIEDVVKILNHDGVFIIQFTDLLSMFKLTAFDNICHEHLEYYSLRVVNNLLEKHGLKIIDVSYNDVNGGSIRITAAHKTSDWKVCISVDDALDKENKYFSLEEGHTFSWFNKNIERTKEKVMGFLKWAKEINKTVFILGASTKSATLLQVCGVTSDLVPYALEVNAEKFGLRTAGSNIKILPETDGLIFHPDYILVPIWHFKENLLKNKKIEAYLKGGGHLVFPLPEFEVFNENIGVKL